MRKMIEALSSNKMGARLIRGMMGGALPMLAGIVQGVAVPYFGIRHWGNEGTSIWYAAISIGALFGVIDQSHIIYAGVKYTNSKIAGLENAIFIIRRCALDSSIILLLKVFLMLAGTLILPLSQTYFAVCVLVLCQGVFGPLSGAYIQILRFEGKYASSVVISGGKGILAGIVAVFCIEVLGFSVFAVICVFGLTILVFDGLIFAGIRKQYDRAGYNFKTVLMTQDSCLLQGLWVSLSSALDTALYSGSIALLKTISLPSEVVNYGTSRTFSNFIMQNFGLIVSPVSHDLVRFAKSGDRNGFETTFFLLTNVLVLLGILALAVFLLIGREIYDVWTNFQFQGDYLILNLVFCSVVIRLCSISILALFQQFLMVNALVAVSALRLLSFGVYLTFQPLNVVSVAKGLVLGEFVAFLVLSTVIIYKRESIAPFLTLRYLLFVHLPAWVVSLMAILTLVTPTVIGSPEYGHWMTVALALALVGYAACIPRGIIQRIWGNLQTFRQ